MDTSHSILVWLSTNRTTGTAARITGSILRTECLCSPFFPVNNNPIGHSRAKPELKWHEIYVHMLYSNPEFYPLHIMARYTNDKNQLNALY
jgi:hypothetical protein